MSSIKDFLQRNKIMVLDGGLSTEIEKYKYPLNTNLWSAELLMKNPSLLEKIHLDYYNAGAECCISSSYQASINGFVQMGCSITEAENLIVLSVELVKNARNHFVKMNPKAIFPFVAASVGPYGAVLADSSEYTGNYLVSSEELLEFHSQRIACLVKGNPDILACETIPKLEEALIIMKVLAKYPTIRCWISFSCKNGYAICDGTPIKECAKELDKFSQIEAIGVNCTHPKYVSSLITILRAYTTKAIIVYPNSFEDYDSKKDKWIGMHSTIQFANAAKEWYEKGAKIIGGCCRTDTSDVAKIHELAKLIRK